MFRHFLSSNVRMCIDNKITADAYIVPLLMDIIASIA